jgi:cell division septum initiation protein DivIVA
MVDSYANTYSSHDLARALESTNQAIRWAEGIIECKWAVELVTHAHRALVEIDEQVAKKRAELTESGQKIIAEAQGVGRRYRDDMLAAAQAEAKEIVEAANQRAANVDTATAAKVAELAKVTADFATAKKRLADHVDQVQRITG